MDESPCYSLQRSCLQSFLVLVERLKPWTNCESHIFVPCIFQQYIYYLFPNSIIFRAFQGIGGSGDFALCTVVILDLVPSHKYAEYSSNIGVVYAISLCVGPLIGGAITEDSTWRWIFLLKSVSALEGTMSHSASNLHWTAYLPRSSLLL